MNYVFPSIMEATPVLTTIPEIIYAFVHGGRGIRTRTDAKTSPSIAIYSVSTDCATETSPKKEAQITQIKTTAITVGVHI